MVALAMLHLWARRPLRLLLTLGLPLQLKAQLPLGALCLRALQNPMSMQSQRMLLQLRKCERVFRNPWKMNQMILNLLLRKRMMRSRLLGLRGLPLIPRELAWARSQRRSDCPAMSPGILLDPQL